MVGGAGGLIGFFGEQLGKYLVTRRLGRFRRGIRPDPNGFLFLAGKRLDELFAARILSTAEEMFDLLNSLLR